MASETAATSSIDWSSHGIETELGWSLQAMYSGFSRAAAAAVASVPGGARGYQVLVAITTETPSSQLALARRLGIDKNAMTAVTDALEQRGLVQRQPDPDDRRARRIVPTKQGRAALSSARAALRAVETALMQGLTDDEQTHLRQLLARVALNTADAGSCTT